MEKKSKYSHWLWEKPGFSQIEGYSPTIYPIIEYSYDDVIKALENIKKHHPNGGRFECLIAVIEDD